MNKTKVKTAALPAGLPVQLMLAAAAIILALLAIPGVGHAQGIVRGAQEGSYEGNRIAGPVGGVVGGAVGAGVATGAAAAPWSTASSSGWKNVPAVVRASSPPGSATSTYRESGESCESSLRASSRSSSR